MLRLLNIEWNKIYYYKTTRIFTILYFLALVLIGVILAFIKPTIGGIQLDIAQLGTFNFPVIWNNITYIVAIMKLFIAVIIVTSITNEFSNGTLKQNLIDGLSKKEFLQSKMLTNLVFAGVSTLFVLVITLALGFTFSSSKENIFKGIEFILAYFIKLYFFFTFCMFLSILFRKSAFALLGIFIWWIVEGILGTIEFSVKALMGDGFEGLSQSDFYFTNYLPLNASSNLIEIPISFNNFIGGTSLFQFRELNWSYVGMTLVYTIIFTYFSFTLLKKRDL